MTAPSNMSLKGLADWVESINLIVKDNSATNSGPSADIVGAASGAKDIVVKLPSTIQASLIGNVTGNVTGNCTGSSGSCTGNAATAYIAATATTAGNAATANIATKLGTSTVGSPNEPIYLNAGIPTKCSGGAGGMGSAFFQSGNAYVTQQAWVPVTFPTAFDEVPKVIICPTGRETWVQYDNVTKTGFQIWIRNSANCYWLAVGYKKS